jgi:hypothetical protein
LLPARACALTDTTTLHTLLQFASKYDDKYSKYGKYDDKVG